MAIVPVAIAGFVVSLVPLSFALGVPMAKPPEPLPEVLPHATHVVEAEVARVVSSSPAPQDAVAGEQLVTLRVKRLLRGTLPADAKSSEVMARKPVGGYALRAGNKGPWLLRYDDTNKRFDILGRYGPDTWRLDVIEAALAR